MLRLFLLLALATPALAEEEVIAEEPKRVTPFDQGKMNLSIGGGSTSNFDRRYFAIGAGFGYFVLDGLELGISAVHQFGDGPSISQVQPRVRYVVQPLVGRSPLIPYVGAFYNHWFIGDSYPDVDAIGGRAGLLYISGRVLLGAGVAVERTVSECVDECWFVYPDFTISLSL
ncbi:MAG TPA: hypothetical protein VFO79_13140 [Xanthomonadales bacterium]|nr:hypothetical protein [Xanthomonadales bacterium]